MTATLEVFETTLAVGPVKAERQPDGSIRVRGVPVFAEVKADDPAVKDGSRQVRDRAWLETALRKHQARRAAGYAPPMTLRHHFSDPRRVGTFDLTHVDEAVVNPGEPPRAVLFGEKVYDDENAFRAAEGYIYRSPEISPDSPDELSALALLRDSAPFNKFPSNPETLDVKVREAFEAAGLSEIPALLAEVHKARLRVAPQVWRGAPEAFAAAPRNGNTEAAASAAQTPNAKEGEMPADTEKKAPSLEERMEAMAAKCFEGMAKKFEAMFAAATGKGDDKPKAESAQGEAEKDTAKSGATEEPKKTETAQAGGPNDALPPAVSELRPGESFSLRELAGKGAPKNGQHLPRDAGQGVEAFAAKHAVLEQTVLNLRGTVEKLQREKDAVQIVASAKKALLDLGAPNVSEAFESAAYNAAVSGGQASVDALVSAVKIGMGLQSRAPEAYGALALGGPAGTSPNGEDDGYKKAVEVFGNRPEKRRAVDALYAEFRSAPEHFRRSLGKTTFYDLCRGNPGINDGARTGEVIRG